MLELEWHQQSKLNVLAVYAPNSPTESQSFWVDLRNYWENNGLIKPDVMMGDFNVVEDSIDRLPGHPDNVTTVEALQNLRYFFELEDGCRIQNPSMQNFTFHQTSTDSRSRIDRIYTTERIAVTASEWEIRPTGGINTDHSMVSFCIIDEKTPHIGAGRWTMPLFILKDHKF